MMVDMAPDLIGRPYGAPDIPDTYPCQLADCTLPSSGQSVTFTVGSASFTVLVCEQHRQQCAYAVQPVDGAYPAVSVVACR